MMMISRKENDDTLGPMKALSLLPFTLAAILIAAPITQAQARGKAPPSKFPMSSQCKRDIDCTFDQHVGCPACPARAPSVVNRRLAIRSASVQGQAIHQPCSPCTKPAGALFARPSCVKGRCVATHVGEILHGDTKTHFYHEPSCPDYNCPTCTERFATFNQAIDAHYTPHACPNMMRVSPANITTDFNRCRRDRDCAVLWRPCGYRRDNISGCGYQWRDPANQKTNNKRRARWANKKPACRPNTSLSCPKGRRPQWIGTSPVCLAGQCFLQSHAPKQHHAPKQRHAPKQHHTPKQP
ncbi:MAG: hypothetical protein KAI47_01535 [Deltaproteobacteria bacterium]|nr:hypothetical protein [Deltaproteobacteria bacterium]